DPQPRARGARAGTAPHRRRLDRPRPPRRPPRRRPAPPADAALAVTVAPGAARSQLELGYIDYSVALVYGSGAMYRAPLIPVAPSRCSDDEQPVRLRE